MGAERRGFRRALAGSGPPITTFAALPSAGSVPGQLRQLSDVNNIVVQSLGGIWRPYGGSQVLAQRSDNPVTIQSIPAAPADVCGPFPGGLVRAGMRLELDCFFGHSGISGGIRAVDLRVGNSGSMASFAWVSSTASGDALIGRISGAVAVRSNTSAQHVGSLGNGSFTVGSTDDRRPTVDFSQPWYTDIFMLSAAETAVNITGATWSAGVATYTTSAAHTLAVGDKDVISGITPSGYNGTFIVSAVGSSTTFSVPMAANPGAYTSGGTSSRISNMISQSYVLTLKG